MGFSAVPVLGQVGIPSHSIVNPDSVSHNFYERETVKGNTITYKSRSFLSDALPYW